MFGHTKKTSLSSQNVTTKKSQSNDDDKVIAAKVNQAPSKPTNIKVVDFKKKPDQTDKIKIKYF
jgi:hypothetical protein